MRRFASKELDQWFRSPDRKPMVLRGARQVGKTWLVRDLAKRHGLKLVELNFEKAPVLADLFSVNDPKEILKNIEAEFDRAIDPGTSILFLDEIQAAPELFATLRWFKEEMPKLPVISAGSLLEFAVSKMNYSMPVGRITYFYLEQLSFFEFLVANGNDVLYEKLASYDYRSPMPQSLHEKCLKLFHDYCLVGGMPEVVRKWVNTKELSSCIKIQKDLIATYQDDFHKYGGKFDAKLLSRILLSVAKQIGNKFVYSRVDPEKKIVPIKTAVTLLSQAKVCTKVLHTTANGLPLGAESNKKFFKALMIDIGLISAQLGLSSGTPLETKNFIFSNKGGMTEQFVGQQLRFLQTPSNDPQLYYWQRTGGRLGEIDYIIQYGNRIIPVEVKSGASGGMKSLHQFMADKELHYAVRLDMNSPSLQNVKVTTTQGNPVSYQLLSIPVYLAEAIEQLLEQKLTDS